MDPLPSFGDLISSLSLSEASEHPHPGSEPSTSSISITRTRSHSRSSVSSLASSLHTRASSISSDDHLSSPPPDISTIAENASRSMRTVAKSRSVGRLRGSRYAPYKDCSRRPSLPCLLPNISLLPPSPTQAGNPQTITEGQAQTQAHPQTHSQPRSRHTRTRSNNTDSHPSSPISLYARRGHSRTNSLNKTSVQAQIALPMVPVSSSGTGTGIMAQAPQSPPFEPPKLPTVPSIQPFNPQCIPQRAPREPLATISSSGTGYPRQMGLRISGFMGTSDSAPARFICA